jgi:hypothetical protein
VLDRIVPNETRRSRMQLRLDLFGERSPHGPDWEALAPDERLVAVAVLARVIAKSIKEKGEDHDNKPTRSR